MLSRPCMPTRFSSAVAPCRTTSWLASSSKVWHFQVLGAASMSSTASTSRRYLQVRTPAPLPPETPKE
eukprot:5930239-Amphidinium_carterae.1